MLENFLSPPILFFFLGMLAVAIRSDLEIPQPFPKILSLYLLLAIGFKGGVELNHSGIGADIFLVLVVAMLMAGLIPFYIFYLLKGKLAVEDAGGIAATYGSVSAVTFVTAIAFLDSQQIAYSGYMVAALALMESPAIVTGILLIRLNKPAAATHQKHGFGEVVREAFTNGSVVVILGSLLIGLLSGESGAAAMHPFVEDIFKGMLAFFLLDMGIVAARRIDALRKAGRFLIFFSALIPFVHAVVGIGLSYVLNLNKGDALLFTILLASGSYIAVPAAFRIAVPRANPGIFVPMALAISFPINIIVGIPLYYFLIQYLIP